MPVKVDPEKAEKEIRSMFYRVNKRPENLDNVMASDGGGYGVKTNRISVLNEV